MSSITEFIGYATQIVSYNVHIPKSFTLNIFRFGLNIFSFGNMYRYKDNTHI